MGRSVHTHTCLHLFLGWIATLGLKNIRPAWIKYHPIIIVMYYSKLPSMKNISETLLWRCHNNFICNEDADNLY